MTKRVAARSGHFAVLINTFEVLTTPRLSRSVAADGIDASKGMQISGVFESDEAEGAARTIGAGAAPLRMEPIEDSAGY